MKESKVKVWFEENKDKICAEVRCISWYAFGFGLAWFVNGKLTKYRCALGIANLHEKGLMKFCDPDEFDYPIYKAELEEACIPHLYLEVEQRLLFFFFLTPCTARFFLLSYPLHRPQ